MFSGDFVKIKLVGDTFDATKIPAIDYSEKMELHLFILLMILRLLKDQATLDSGNFRTNQRKDLIMFLFRLVVVVCWRVLLSVFSVLSPDTKIIGVETKGAGYPMRASIDARLQRRIAEN